MTSQQPTWWPSWGDAPAVIIAGGPSLTDDDVAIALGSGAHIATINESWRKAPCAEIHYACDWKWWAQRGPALGAVKGRRVVGVWPDQMPANARGFGLVSTCANVRPNHLKMIWDGPQIGSGQNSAFQMTNLAARWGCRQIALLGVDCSDPKAHWHAPHAYDGRPHPRPLDVQRWIAAWQSAAPEMRSRGIDIVNCSPGTQLRALPRAGLSETLARWSESYGNPSPRIALA